MACQDLGTQIHFWADFQAACRLRGWNKRQIDQLKFVPPNLAELMAGVLLAYIGMFLGVSRRWQDAPLRLTPWLVVSSHWGSQDIGVQEPFPFAAGRAVVSVTGFFLVAQ